MPVLRYEDKSTSGRKIFALPEDRTAIFGRETYCDFQLRMEGSISREHFSVGKDESGAWLLIDLGSSNGTFLNGVKLGNDIEELKEGDEIRAGSQKFFFFRQAPVEPPPPHPPKDDTPKTFGEKMREILKRN